MITSLTHVKTIHFGTGIFLLGVEFCRFKTGIQRGFDGKQSKAQ